MRSLAIEIFISVICTLHVTAIAVILVLWDTFHCIHPVYTKHMFALRVSSLFGLYFSYEPSTLHTYYMFVLYTIRSHREATADRRHKESATLQEIGRNLPISQSQVDKGSHSSVIRLAINFIKARELMSTIGVDFSK